MKNVENVLRPALSCINEQMNEWMICVKIKCNPSILLDNFYKLSCFLLIFFALLFPIHGSFFTV